MGKKNQLKKKSNNKKKKDAKNFPSLPGDSAGGSNASLSSADHSAASSVAGDPDSRAQSDHDDSSSVGEPSSVTDEPESNAGRSDMESEAVSTDKASHDSSPQEQQQQPAIVVETTEQTEDAPTSKATSPETHSAPRDSEAQGEEPVQKESPKAQADDVWLAGSSSSLKDASWTLVEGGSTPAENATQQNIEDVSSEPKLASLDSQVPKEQADEKQNPYAALETETEAEHTNATDAAQRELENRDQNVSSQDTKDDTKEDAKEDAKDTDTTAANAPIRHPDDTNEHELIGDQDIDVEHMEHTEHHTDDSGDEQPHELSTSDPAAENMDDTASKPTETTPAEDIPSEDHGDSAPASEKDTQIEAKTDEKSSEDQKPSEGSPEPSTKEEQVEPENQSDAPTEKETSTSQIETKQEEDPLKEEYLHKEVPKAEEGYHEDKPGTAQESNPVHSQETPQKSSWTESTAAPPEVKPVEEHTEAEQTPTDTDGDAPSQQAVEIQPVAADSITTDEVEQAKEIDQPAVHTPKDIEPPAIVENGFRDENKLEAVDSSLLPTVSEATHDNQEAKSQSLDETDATQAPAPAEVTDKESVPEIESPATVNEERKEPETHTVAGISQDPIPNGDASNEAETRTATSEAPTVLQLAPDDREKEPKAHDVTDNAQSTAIPETTQEEYEEESAVSKAGEPHAALLQTSQGQQEHNIEATELSPYPSDVTSAMQEAMQSKAMPALQPTQDAMPTRGFADTKVNEQPTTVHVGEATSQPSVDLAKLATKASSQAKPTDTARAPVPTKSSWSTSSESAPPSSGNPVGSFEHIATHGPPVADEPNLESDTSEHTHGSLTHAAQSAPLMRELPSERDDAVRTLPSAMQFASSTQRSGNDQSSTSEDEADESDYPESTDSIHGEHTASNIAYDRRDHDDPSSSSDEPDNSDDSDYVPSDMSESEHTSSAEDEHDHEDEHEHEQESEVEELQSQIEVSPAGSSLEFVEISQSEESEKGISNFGSELGSDEEAPPELLQEFLEKAEEDAPHDKKEFFEQSFDIFEAAEQLRNNRDPTMDLVPRSAVSRLARDYVNLLDTYLRKLNSDSTDKEEKLMVRNLFCVWSLVEILCFIGSDAYAIVGDLSSWLNLFYPVGDAGLVPNASETDWAHVQSHLLRGNIEEVVEILEIRAPTLSESIQWHISQFTHLLKAMPPLATGIVHSKRINLWAQWTEMRSAAYTEFKRLKDTAAADQQVLGELDTLYKILLGDEQSLISHGSVLESHIGGLVYGDPFRKCGTAGTFSTRVNNRKFGADPLETACQYFWAHDWEEALSHLDDFWLQTHLGHLLIVADMLPGGDSKDISDGPGVSPVYNIMNLYGQNLATEYDMWPEAMAYVTACQTHKEQWAKELMDLRSLESEHVDTLHRMLELCVAYEVLFPQRSVRRAIGKRQEKEGKQSDASKSFALAADTDGLDRLADQALQRYLKEGTLEDIMDVTEETKDAISKSKHYLFFAQFKELRHKIETHDYAGATDLIKQLLSHTNAPKEYKMVLLTNCLPVLEQATPERPVFTEQETLYLIRQYQITADECQNMRHVFEEEYKRITGKQASAAEVMADIHRRLSYNLAVALIL